MPTYVYRREDGSTFELEQRITEEALTTCPETGQSVQRVITGSAGLIFKGSGFYLTDYARKNGNGAKADKSNDSTKTADAKSSSTGETGKTKTPASTSS